MITYSNLNKPVFGKRRVLSWEEVEAMPASTVAAGSASGAGGPKAPRDAHCKYTPGPWHVGMNPGPMVYGMHGVQVADCRNMFAGPNEDGHNARLIAAAPELLSNLKRLIDNIESGSYESTGQCVDKCRAVIVKAEGVCHD